MRVADIMTRDVQTADEGQSFTEVARRFRDHGISSVVVVEDRTPAGIVTERDVVNVVADGLDPAATTVGERMTRDLATVSSSADVAEAASLMAARGIRHLPVLHRGKLAGIVSIRDVTMWAVDELTGGHELADIESSSAALAAANQAKRRAFTP